MSYAKQCRESFRALIHSITTSKFPIFEAEILKSAWNLTEASAARGRRLDLTPSYYVYVLLDSRKPGKFVYEFPGGRKVAFNHQPFYVGKGKGTRVQKHAVDARNKKEKGRKLGYKENTLLAIQNAGKRVIEKILSVPSIEAVAYAKEICLIDNIGRASNKTGPLTNLTRGGSGGDTWGVQGIRHTPESKAKLRAKRLGVSWGRHTAEHRATIGAKVRAKLLGRTPTPEQIRKGAEARVGKPHKQKYVKCTHCGVSTTTTNIIRWHGDRCKLKDQRGTQNSTQYHK